MKCYFNPIMFVASVSAVTKGDSKISNTRDRVLPKYNVQPSGVYMKH